MLCSCEQDSAEIGSDFFTDGALDFSYIDSSTVMLSTIQLDEQVTSLSDRMLVGTHHDEKLGKISASAFFQVAPSSNPDFEDRTVEYDYLSIVLPLTQYYYYDTLLPMTLNVHRVIEEIKTDDGYHYNTSTFGIETESLGSITFNPRPHSDSVEIKLSDVLGNEIFEDIRNKTGNVTVLNFLKYFRGIAVIPDTTQSASFIGLSKGIKLQLHYFDKSITPTANRQIEFTIQETPGSYFTNINSNRKSTKLEALTSIEGRIGSAETDDESYLQAGIGLSLRVDLPYLRTLKQLENFYPTRAILEIFPVRRSYDLTSSLPLELTVFKADKRNNIYEEIEETASLVEDTDLGRDTYYTFDATGFVKEQMELQPLNENALIFTTDKDSYPVSIDRIYAASPDYEYRTRIRIYFATVNQ